LHHPTILVLQKGIPPPSRVKPVPILIIIFIINQAYLSTSSSNWKAVVDMITVTFYFLFRPGEYTGTTSYDTPFCLQEVELHVGGRPLNTMTASSKDLDAATTVSLTFTAQKNGTHSEVITHGLSTDPLACTVKAVIRWLHHLHFHKSAKSIPLASYFHNGKCIAVKAKDITEALCLGTLTTSQQKGLHQQYISALLLRAGDAMTIICGQIDHNTIECLAAGITMP
jgi:hypothetical protein